MNTKALFKAGYFFILQKMSHGIRYNLNKNILKNAYIASQMLRSKKASGNNASLKGFDDLKCIFVHIPKAAGISINRALFGNAGGSHRSIFQYSLIYNELEFDEYYKFSFVRNPWDRLLSAYLFLKEGGLHENDANWGEKKLKQYNCFHDFVKNWVNKSNIEKEIHFKPQYKFITLNGKIAVDDVYKVENIHVNFSKICAKLDVVNNLQTLNKTKVKLENYKNYYNEETINIVGRVYKKDIELFDYSFDGSK